jgi:hypothetical protein
MQDISQDIRNFKRTSQVQGRKTIKKKSGAGMTTRVLFTGDAGGLRFFDTMANCCSGNV